jgi:hypothetical protein
MKFKELYPDAQPLEVEVEPGVELSPRIFSCDACGTRTGWRYVMDDCPSVPCCSQDCVKTIQASIIASQAREANQLEAFASKSGQTLVYEAFTGRPLDEVDSSGVKEAV